MGLEFSALRMINDCLGKEVIIEEKNGVKITTKRVNPWVGSLGVLCGTAIVLSLLDGGSGMITKTFGHVCVNCSKVM
jgi:hypothetical protein